MQSSTQVFGHQCDVININHTIHQYLFSNFSSYHLPVEQKEKIKHKSTHHGAVDKP